MTQYQLILSAPTLNTLGSLKLPIKTAYAIFNLNKKIAEFKDFFIEQEKKLIDEYHGEIKENGQITFSNTEDTAGFARKHAELKALEATDLEPLKIKMTDLKDERLSATEIQALDGIVEFIDE